MIPLATLLLSLTVLVGLLVAMAITFALMYLGHIPFGPPPRWVFRTMWTGLFIGGVGMIAAALDLALK